MNTNEQNFCTHYFNGGSIPMEVKLKDKTIHKLKQYEEIQTTKENYITHSRWLLYANSKFVKIKLDKIKDYKNFIG